MPAGRELFRLFGILGIEGIAQSAKELRAFDKEVRAAQQKIARLGRDMEKLGKTLTIGVTLPLAAAAGAMVSSVARASDLNETISKTNEVFGASSAAIQEWSKGTAASIGQSQQEALDAAATFGIFGNAAGLVGEDLSSFAITFTELASDMASFFNTSPEDAVIAIGAAFRGETEPIRRYGVLLDDATLRNKAFELGIISSTKKALTPQNKILAARAVILEQTSKAQGDFARTSGGLANQQRILEAQLKNLSAELGSEFLPIALDVVGALNKEAIPALKSALQWLRALSPEMKKTIGGWLVLVGAIGPVAIALGKVIQIGLPLIRLYKALRAGQISLNVAMAANPVGLLIAALGALTAAGIYLYNNWEDVSRFLKESWEDIAYAFQRGTSTAELFINELVLAALKAVQEIAGNIPVLGKVIDAAIANTEAYKKEKELFILTVEKEREAINKQREAEEKAREAKDKARAATERAAAAEREYRDNVDESSNADSEAAEEAKKKAIERDKFSAAMARRRDKAVMGESALLDKAYADELAKAKALGADTQAIEEFYALERSRLRQQEADEANARRDAQLQADIDAKEEELANAKRVADEKKRLALAAVDYAASGINQLGDISNKFTSNEIQRIEMRKAVDIARINSSVMSEEKKAAAVLAIENQADSRITALKRKQAKRDKALAIFNVAVSTGVAIMKAYEQLGPIAGSVAAVLLAALGIAQTVAIADEPIPFADGGLVRKSPGGVNAVVGEGNQDELVFPLESGTDLLADRLMARLQGIGMAPVNAQTVQAGENMPKRVINLNIGTLVADDRGIKQLERRLERVRISEDQRKGVA